MHVFEQNIASKLAVDTPLAAGAPLVVALSGGADSVALLAVLTALGYECVAAHCNFHLRGAESQRDEAHAMAIAEALGVDLYIKNFDVDARCQATGESVEMACRALRYEWFIDLLEREHARAIAVGHHREDQVETFFINLLRGTGIAGLTGMSVFSGHIVRPMLDVSRADIEAYLHHRGLAWVDDSTNAESEYRRNRLRNIVLPALEEQFPGAADAILATMRRLADNRSVYDAAVVDASRRYISADGASVNIAALSAEMPAQRARTLLFELLRPRGFNMTQAENMLNAASGTVFTSSTHRAELSHGALHISDLATGVDADSAVAVSLRRDITEPIRIAIENEHITAFAPKRDVYTIYLDESVLNDNPHFELRHWRRGDRIIPFGQTKSKLVSDIFANARLSAAQKREAWLLTRNGTVLWVVGLRPSAHFAVTPDTRRYLRLTLEK